MYYHNVVNVSCMVVRPEMCWLEKMEALTTIIIIILFLRKKGVYWNACSQSQLSFLN